jgi:MFS family permease
MFTFMTNIAIVVTADKVANSAQAGFILTFFSAASFVSSMLYGKIHQALKKFTMTAAIFLIGSSLAIMLKGTSYPVFLVAAAMCGLGFGLGQSDFISKCVGSVPRPAATSAMGLMTSFGGIGSFSSPFLLTFLTSTFAIKGIRAPWAIASTGLLVGCVIYTIVIIVAKPKDDSVKAS